MVNLANYDNSWYKPGNPFKRFIWYYVNVIFFKSSLFPFYRFKIFLLKLFGAAVGEGVLIKPNVNIKYPWLLTIGNNVWVGENVWIDNLAKVSIGNNVCISQGVLLLCGNHNYSSPTFNLIVKPIIIEEGVWLTAKCIVTGNAVCAKNSVFGIGTVINFISEPNAIYNGNPAIKIKERKIYFN